MTSLSDVELHQIRILLCFVPISVLSWPFDICLPTGRERSQEMMKIDQERQGDWNQNEWVSSLERKIEQVQKGQS